MTNTDIATAPAKQAGTLVSSFAERFGMNPAQVLPALKNTAFRQRNDNNGRPVEVTNEQMMALLVVANEYGLNPWTREIYAFPDKGGIVPIVGVDGWNRIINQHPQFDGVEFAFGTEDGFGQYCEATIYRKDRNRPTVIREYMNECKRNTEPWGKWPMRMLRHKALIQCARVAFSYSGIYEPDEGDRIIEGGDMVRQVNPQVSDDAVLSINARVAARRSEPVTIDQPAEDAPRAEPAASVGAEPAAEPPAEKPARQRQAKAAQAEAPAITYAQIREQLEKAGSVDELDAAASVIDTQPVDLGKELSEIYKARREALAA